MDFHPWSRKLRENDIYGILFKKFFHWNFYKKIKLANLLEIKFSNLGEYFESRNYTVDLTMVRRKNTFSFRFVIKFECI